MTNKSDNNTNQGKFYMRRQSQQTGSEEPAQVPMTPVSSFPTHALVMTLTQQKPIFQGQGNIDYVCGRCAALILHRVSLKNARGLVFECICGAYNVLPTNLPVPGE